VTLSRERLAYIACAGPVVFVALVALLHALDPDRNDTDAMSEYALGEYGLLMNAAFLGAGVGVGALALGLRDAVAPSTSRRVALALLAIAALGWILLGLGNIDAEGEDTTWHGVVHGIGFLLTIPTMLGAPFALARAFSRDGRWSPLHRWLPALGVAAVLAFVLAFGDVVSPVTVRLFDALALATVVVTALRLRTLE
jgi:hypothetical protein